MTNEDILKEYKCQAVGDGLKIIKGKQTKQRAKMFFVKKKARNKLEERLLKLKGEYIPPEIDGVKTDVIETGEYYTLNAYREKHRPIKAGVSMCCRYNTACTSGIPVWHEGRRKALMNRHCCERLNRVSPVKGDPVMQPSFFDDGNPETDIVGFVDTWYNATPSRDNLMDAGLVTLTEDMQPILVEGQYKEEIASVSVGDLLWKEGRTTGKTEGKVIATGATSLVRRRDNTVMKFVNQIITEKMLEGGDSSSIAFKGDKIAAQGFAGGSTTSVFTPFQTVKDYFGFSFSQGGFTRDYYVATGRSWYVRPPLGETNTLVNLNLRTSPEVSNNFVRTLPIGTKINILEYVGQNQEWHWCRINL